MYTLFAFAFAEPDDDCPHQVEPAGSEIPVNVRGRDM